jgi:mono/diheme cytochrome c family protein
MIALVMAAALAAPADSQSAILARGEAIAVERCGHCHAVGWTGASLRQDAPAFRDLGRNYPVSDLIEALAQGARPTHAAMPPFTLPLSDARALSAYVRSIQTH